MKKILFTVALTTLSFLGFSQDEIEISNNKYHLYGPNSNWGQYLQVGGNGRVTTNASVVATNGNLHLDSKEGFSLYLNHYSLGNTYLNTQGGFVGIGNSSPSKPLHIKSSTEHHQIRIEGTNNKHAWIQVYPSGSDVINWQIGANNSGFSIYDRTTSAYRFTVANSGNIGIGTNNPDPNSGIHMYQDRYTLYGPNSTWGEYLQVGGNGRVNNIASVVSTNGNLHLDSKNGSATYLNHYSTGDTYLNTQGGSVGIGTTSHGSHKLAVGGSIGAREIKVEASGWSDFVFENDYQLRTLEEVEKHIEENGHLPEIPSEAEVTENGINLGEMNAKLLQKIEELTLYMIDMNKQMKEFKSENQELKEKVNRLENE